MEKISEKKAHAKFSASGSYRWMNCHGSIALIEKAPPQRESAYANEGTTAHECLEFLLKNRLKLSAATTQAKKKYDSEMVTHALSAVAWIEDKALDVLGENEVLIETKVDASSFTCPDQFGTLDAAIVQEFGKLVVIDYKYGSGILVDPEQNSQLIYYALGLAHKYDYNFVDVEIVVIQPRAYHESGDTVRAWTCSMDELMAWREKFKTGVAKASDPFATLKSGDWCKFCPASTICPELKEKAMEQAAIVFDDVKGIESIPEPKSIAIKNLGTLLDACDKLEDWITAIRAHATHVLERGGRVQGFKLVDKRPTRKWKDVEGATLVAAKSFGVDALTNPEIISPAQFEKAFKNDPRAKIFMDKNVEAKSSGTTLVRDTDKRSEVRVIETVFSEVNEKTGKEDKQKIWLPKRSPRRKSHLRSKKSSRKR